MASVACGATSSPDKSEPAGGAASGCRFSRAARLLTPAQFARVFKKNRRSADQYWTLLYAPNEIHHARVGMAVAKKKIKKSVERNRVKRMVRESFRVNGTLPAVDIVVLPTARCDGADSAVLRASLDKHWARIAITCRSR